MPDDTVVTTITTTVTINRTTRKTKVRVNVDGPLTVETIPAAAIKLGSMASSIMGANFKHNTKILRRSILRAGSDKAFAAQMVEAAKQPEEEV